MTAQSEVELRTIDELTAATGTSVRTTRYYASLGLLPPPVRRGRVAYYGPVHVARLELIRALQEHGFTLAAIERYLGGVPADCSPEELALQRSLLTAWSPGRWETVDRSEAEVRAGRPLSEQDIAWLTRAGVLRERGADPPELQVLPQLQLAVELRDVGMPLAGITEAGEAVRRHMSELADELTEVLNTTVMARYRTAGLSREDADQFERTLHNLRTLTLEAIVTAFQTAASQLVTKSLTVPAEEETGS
jgi:DNA-binding transcriptional MerR regulator